MRRSFKFLFFVAFFTLINANLFSQKNKNSSYIRKDTIPLKYSFNQNQEGGLFLKKPTKKQITYDTKLNKFVIVEKIGEYTISTPVFMSTQEYDKFKLKKDIAQYFREKQVASSDRLINKKARKNLLPKYYVNSKFFESIFGGNEVEVNPTGQINIKLGVIYQRTENPQISVENQSSFTFDFDQQISASLQARIGKRLRVRANYDTQSTFDFQNIIKLEYTPDEDDIIQKLDAGNINMPIRNSLINGAQALFGVRTDLQFGRTTIRTAFSQQNSQTKNIVAKGGAVIEPFEFQATDYDNDRHFFLSQFFRSTFSKSLSNYPLISSPINITRIEVWVTNRSQNVKDYRNIVAFADIGESNPKDMVSATVLGSSKPVTANVGGEITNLPYNQVNKIGTNLLQEVVGGIRDVQTLEPAIKAIDPKAKQGLNYTYLQNARKLQQNEFTLNPQLGYISLNRRLNDGEVLAVAYEYTVIGASNGETVFKVGEFSNDGINSPKNIALKLLRSEVLTTSRTVGLETLPFPTWSLMMKNIYPLGAFQLQNEGFRLELLYRDDQTGVLLNTLQGANDTDLQDKTILSLLNLDRLDQTQYPIKGGDGFFDYVEGVTINSEKGYVIFPEVEPFGNHLDKALISEKDKDKYVFKELYLTTKTQAKNEYQNKDKFFLKGYYKSSTSSDGISLNAFNIPKGSVTVTAGGRTLVEGVDYVVDYSFGKVQILDPGLEASGIPINARVENNAFFNQQRKTFLGIDLEHKVSDNFILGGTFLNVSEKPITPKINYGAEPINNIMLGFNFDYSKEVPYFTKLVNKLPFTETDVPSNISLRGDVAYLIPGSPKGINVNGQATSYVDDFETSQIPISLNAPQQWKLASTPLTSGFNGDSFDLNYNDKRAKLAWYNIDQLFYTSSRNRPNNINEAELSRDEVRQVSFSELFPNTDLDITQLNLVRTLDLAYYPSERGPYNYNTSLDIPENNWGGIMRSLTTNNFEQANVEYIQFWLMDPYENYKITAEEGLPSDIDPTLPANQSGKLLLNLGNLSEDILKDARKQYENGLSTTSNPTTEKETIWGNVPVNPSILYAFNNESQDRKEQDLGLDGLTDEEEKIKFPAFANLEDPAGDNFKFFRGADYDAVNASILQRYKLYNGTQGNSPTAGQSKESFPTSSTSYPDTEDINNDQTMNTVSSYFEYEISLNKTDLPTSIIDLQSRTNKNHIVDVKENTVTLSNGQSRTSRWYLFRIPVRSGYTRSFGGISDFNSIRFMRMFLTGFKIPVVLRFGQLELVRGDWRRYTKTLDPKIIPQKKLTTEEINRFETGVVNIEENEDRYVLPPGISRERLQGTNRIQRQNEQSTTLKVSDLAPEEARAIYKNITIDMRRYKNLKMYLHAEGDLNTVQDNDISAIIRFGTDLNDNYYQIEKSLILSKKAQRPTPIEAWPEENNLDILLSELTSLKLKRDEAGVSAATIYEGTTENGLKISLKGNPTLAQIRTVLLGMKNNTAQAKSVEVWFNELRAVGFDNEGGWAAVLGADVNFADLADVSFSGNISTVGFGSVEQRVQERSIEEVKQYNVATNVQLGKMIPAKWNMQIPMSYTYAEEFRDPKYNAQYQDVIQDDVRQSVSESVVKKGENAQDYTKRKGISFINVKKNRDSENKKPPRFYDVENIALSYAFNEEFHKDYNIQKYVNQNVTAGANYSFSFKPWEIAPFKKSKRFTSRHWKIIKDLNFNPVPKSVLINSKINRVYNAQQSRNLIDIGLSEQPELKQRRFMFDWDYAIAFDLTRSLQFNFNAANSNIYDSYGRNEDLGIYDKFFTIGRPNHYHQKLNATYKVPIDKLPYLDFLSANYGYDADFDWQSSAQSPEVREKIGNIIQNSSTHNLNASVNFDRLYKNLGLNKLFHNRVSKKSSRKGKKTKKRKKSRRRSSAGKKITDGFYSLLTAVKRARVNYSQSNKTLLGGYKPTVGFLGRDSYDGSSSPTLGFVFGSQSDIILTAIENNWLITRDPNKLDDLYYNKTYGKHHTEKLNYNVSLKPLRNLTIDLTGNSVKTSSLNQQLDVLGTYDSANNSYINRSLNTTIQSFETGNYSTSYAMIGSVFTNNDELFNTFLKNRTIISNRLAKDSGLSNSQTEGEPGFKLSGQQVLLPAFLAAYSNKDARSVNTSFFRKFPIPNWTLRFNGLMKKKWFKRNFSSFTVSHGYKSLYTINNYTNNFQFDKDDSSITNISGNYQPEYLISQVLLSDEFSPLIRLDMKMRNSFSIKGEVKKDRTLTLNFNNNTLTDVKGLEYILGLGYRIKDVKFVTSITGRKQTIKGDINLRADLSLRNNLTLIRSIDEVNSQITAGERLLGLKFSADYNLTKNLTAAFYYNHNTFEYAISTSFPRQSVNAGINLVYRLGN